MSCLDSRDGSGTAAGRRLQRHTGPPQQPEETEPAAAGDDAVVVDDPEPEEEPDDDVQPVADAGRTVENWRIVDALDLAAGSNPGSMTFLQDGSLLMPAGSSAVNVVDLDAGQAHLVGAMTADGAPCRATTHLWRYSMTNCCTGTSTPPRCPGSGSLPSTALVSPPRSSSRRARPT